MRRTNFCLLLFVLPALLNFLVFRYLPIAWAVRASLYDYSLLTGFGKFLGIANYQELLSDATFLRSLWVSLRFFLLYVPMVVIGSLFLGSLVNQPRGSVTVLRAIIFIPVVTSFVVVSMIWGMMLNKDVGIVNGLLSTFGIERVAFLLNAKTALPSIVGITAWKNLGYSVIVVVAGLRGIDDSYYECAKLEGASRFRTFRQITVPMIHRQIMFISIWATIQSFQAFVPVQTLTQGGPARSTNLTVYHLYNIGFNFGRMGYATSMAMVMVILLLFISVGQMRLLRRQES